MRAANETSLLPEQRMVELHTHRRDRTRRYGTIEWSSIKANRSSVFLAAGEG